MRILFIVALLALVLHPKAHCQNPQQPQRKVLREQTEIVKQQGLFFAVLTREFADGGAASESFRIGDSVATKGVLVASTLQETDQMANDVEITSRFPVAITEKIRYLRKLDTLLGKSVLDSIRLARRDLLNDGWGVGAKGVTPDELKFTITAQGKLRYQIGTGTKKRAEFLGAVVRLYDYNGRSTVDFFADRASQPGLNGPLRFVTPDRSERMLAPGGIDPAGELAERGARETTAPVAAPEPSTYNLNPDGTVSVVEGGKIVTYKYSSKKWRKL